MRKGVSPIVAVVLLIAISVISAVGVYFWIGGYTTQQATPSVPISIAAQTAICTTSGPEINITVILQNLDSTDPLDVALYITDENGMALANKSDIDSLAAGEQTVITFANQSTTAAALTLGNTYVIYGAADVSQAQVTCLEA